MFFKIKLHKNTYLERIAAHNLPFASQMITQGDYSEFVDRQVQHLLDDNPDAQAIVFANDDVFHG